MAAAGESTCHSDPNFAVICSFLDKYGELLGLPEISYVDLQEYLEDTKAVARVLVDIHVRLLKRIGKTNVNHERFERSVTKFCFYFSDRDGWEVERFGYRHAQLSTKLRILKNLLECQFDYNVKFKEKINEFGPEEMRFLPAGRDKDGMTYWYLLDRDLNVFVYREEPDDENAESWKLICSDRHQLAQLVERLKNNTQKTSLEEGKDDRCSVFTDESKSTSKEGSPVTEEKPTDIKPIKIKLEETSTRENHSGANQVASVSDVKSERELATKNDGESVRKESSRIKTSKDGGENDGKRNEMKVKQEPGEVGLPSSTAEGASETSVIIVSQSRSKSRKMAGDLKEKEQAKKRKNRDQEAHPSGDGRAVKKAEKEQLEEKAAPTHKEFCWEVKGGLRKKHQLATLAEKYDTKKSVGVGEREGRDVSIRENAEISKQAIKNGEVIADDKSARNQVLNGSEVLDQKDGGCCILTSTSSQKNTEKKSPDGLPDHEVKNSSQSPAAIGDKKEDLKAKTSLSQDEQEGKKMLLSLSAQDSVRETEEEAKAKKALVANGIDSCVELTGAMDSTKTAKDAYSDSLLKGTDSNTAENKERLAQQGSKSEFLRTEGENQTSCGQGRESDTAKLSSFLAQSETPPKNKEAVENKDANQSELKVSSDGGVVQNVLVKEEENKEPQELNTPEGPCAQKQTDAKIDKHVVEEKNLNPQVATETIIKFDDVVETVCTESSHAVEPLVENSSKSKKSDEEEQCETKMKDSAPEIGQKEDVPIQASVIEQSNDLEDKKDKRVTPETSCEKGKVTAESSCAGDTKTLESSHEKNKMTADRSLERDQMETAENSCENLKQSEEVDVQKSECAQISSRQDSKDHPKEEVAKDEMLTEPQKSECAQLSCRPDSKDHLKEEPAKDEILTEPQKSECAQISCRPDNKDHLKEEATKDEILTEPQKSECAQISCRPDNKDHLKEEATKDEILTEPQKSECAQISCRPDNKGYPKEKAVKDEILTEPHVANQELGSAVNLPLGDGKKLNSKSSVGTDGQSATEGDHKSIESSADFEKSSDSRAAVQKLSDRDSMPEEQADSDHWIKSEIRTDLEESMESPDQHDLDNATEPETALAEKPDRKVPADLNKQDGSSDACMGREPAVADEDACSKNLRKELEVTGARHIEETSVSKEKDIECMPDSEGLRKTSKVNEPLVMARTQLISQKTDSNSCSEAAVQKATMLQEAVGKTESVEKVAENQAVGEGGCEQDKIAHPVVDLSQSSGKKCELLRSSTYRESASTVRPRSEEINSGVGSTRHASKGDHNKDSEVRDMPHCVHDKKQHLTDDEAAIDLTCKPYAKRNPDGFESYSIGKSTVESPKSVKAGSKHDEGSGDVTKEILQIENNVTRSTSMETAEKKDVDCSEKQNDGSDGTEIFATAGSCAGLLEQNTNVGADRVAEVQNDVSKTEKISEHEQKVLEETINVESDGSRTAADQEKSLQETEHKPQEVCGRKVKRARRKPVDTGKEKVVSDKDGDVQSAEVEHEVNHTETVVCHIEPVEGKKKPKRQTKLPKKFVEKEERKVIGKDEVGDEKKESLREDGVNMIAPNSAGDDKKGMVNGHHEVRNADSAGIEGNPPCLPPIRGKGVKRGRGGRRGGSQVRKRSAPEMVSDDTNSEPMEKQAKRGAIRKRNVGRSRPNRKTPKPCENSSDSDIPLSRVSSRGRKGRKTSKAARSSKKKKNRLALEDGFSSSSDDSPLSKACKKKKIVGEDSSDFEPEEPVVPKKKDRKIAKKKEAEAAHKELETAEETISTRRSLRLQNIKKKEPEPELTSEDDHTVVDDSSEVCLSTEEDSGDEDFSPQGRNRLRQAALKSKKKQEEVPADDTPCLICEKCTHPEMMLLCDSCDSGYHMACLRPPLMVVPEGDWFCPPCEHNKLIERLTEYLHVLETSSRKKERLVRRKERLAFVGISLDNILKEEKKPVKQEYLSEEEEEAEERFHHQATRKTQHSSGNKHKRYKHHSREESPLPEEVYAKRSCRTRSNVSYQFKEFDELINSAIEEDIKLPKPPRPPKPPGISRGKDMSNILGMDSDEEKELQRKQKEEQISSEAVEGRPPPVLKKKPRRRLTTLDSDDNQEEDDDSEEFKLSESDEDSEASVEPSVEEDDLSDESGEWKPQRTWYNKATRKSSRNRGKRNLWSRYDEDFVVDDEYDSDERANKRRSTRNSSKRRIHYRDWESETEESMDTDDTEASLSSVYSDDSVLKKKKDKKQRKKFCSESESSGSEYMVRISKKKKRRVESSDSEEENEPGKAKSLGAAESGKASKEPQAVASTPKTKAGPRKPQFSDDDSQTEIENHEEKEEFIPQRKKKNVLRDSSSEEEKPVCSNNAEDEETEVEEEKAEPVEEKKSVETKEEQAVADQEKAAEKKEQVSESSVTADKHESFENKVPVVKLIKVVTGLETAVVAEKKEPVSKPDKGSAEENEHQSQGVEKIGKKVNKGKPRFKGKGTGKSKKSEVQEPVECREDGAQSKVAVPSKERSEASTTTSDAGGSFSSQASQAASSTKSAVPNFLNVDTVKDSPQAGVVHPPPLPCPPEGVLAPGDVGFRYPGGGEFRHSVEGGFQSPPYDPRFQSPESPEFRSRGFQGPFCHGPYPLLGEQFRVPGPENFQPPGPAEYFRPQGANTFGPHGQAGQVPRPEAFKQMPQRQERFQPCGPEGFRPSQPEGFHPGGPYSPFHGSPQHFYPPTQPFQGHPPAGYGMYPHRFPAGPVQGPFGTGPHPNTSNFHPMGPPLSQVPGVPPAGRGGFMIDNLLRGNTSGHSFAEEIPPPPTQSQIPPPHMTPPHMTPPHVTPPQQSLQPPQHPPSQQQPSQRPLHSPRSPGQDDDDMGDVSDIVSYVMNDDFFKQQTSS